MREINSGVYCFRTGPLLEVIRELQPNNDQGELYLTDVVSALRSRGQRVTGFCCGDPQEILGVNDRVQLAEAGAILRRRINQAWMLYGVTLVDPETAYIDATVDIGRDTLIEPQVYLQRCV